jgi:uncharacterized protein
MLVAGMIAAGAVYGGALTFIYANQSKLLYPGSEPAAEPAAAGLLDVQEVRIETEDGLRLLAWWKPPREGMPVVVYWHGNAGTLGSRANKFVAFGEHGYGMLMLAYRGYSGNPGRPDEASMIKDAVTATNWVAQRSDGPLIYYGESLGAAVALQLSLRVRPSAIVLEGAFDSAANLAQARYPLFPAARLIRDRWDSLAIASAVPAPVLMLHGGQDRIVPARHAERLYAELPESKRFLRLEEAGHVDLFDHGASEVVFAWLHKRGV